MQHESCPQQGTPLLFAGNSSVTRPCSPLPLRCCSQVDFPESVEEGLVSALSQVLPGPAPDANGVMDADDAEECHMKTVQDMEEEIKQRHRMSRQASTNAYDSDDEDDMHRGGQRVQCAQQ